MKTLHRIRRHLLMLLLLMLHSASAADFSKCGTDDKMICFVHGKSCTKIQKDKYVMLYEEISNDCKRYFIIQAVSLEKVQIEFRDNTFDKVAGAGFYSEGVKESFTCKNNKAAASKTDVKYTAEDINDNSAPSNELYCKFTLTATNSQKNIKNALNEYPPEKVVSLKDRTKTIDGIITSGLNFPCDVLWSKPIFNINDVEEDEIPSNLMANNDANRQCRADYVNWYKENEASKWVKIIESFQCDAANGVIKTSKIEDGSRVTVNLDTGKTKCTKKKCAECTCTFCDDHNESRPNLTAPIDGTCAKMTCQKKMIVHLSATDYQVHPSTTINCTLESKWKDFEDKPIVNITCIDEVRCSELNPIKTDCSGVATEESDNKKIVKNCTEASLTDSGAHVCDGSKETRFLQPGPSEKEHQGVTLFKCDSATGHWKATLADGKTVVPVITDTNVYCMEDIKQDDAKSSEQVTTGGLSGGQLIGIIIGVAFVAVIIVIVVVLCLRRHFKKKGNRDEMKSVSVTGRGDKKSKKKNWTLGKSSGSKTSEQISAPPPPPCPDSLNLPNEPEPTPPSQQPSSGGGVPPAVGPDTGKPDKPAELIDIKLDSEKKDTEKESKKEGKAKDDPSVVNTVTGTTFDKSKVDPGTVSTKKTNNNESARSNTGTGTGSKVDSKPKKKLKVKDGKVELDKHGRGMTDDDDYNIDEGAKPVDAVDKNKKPYAPEVDPRKKMINVTVTEDEDGRIQQKNKPQPF